MSYNVQVYCMPVQLVPCRWCVNNGDLIMTLPYLYVNLVLTLHCEEPLKYESNY